ncbi:MAG TPA: hypothetical protein DCY53_00155 [Desulfobacteraceae bacterium]|nr:hypothetical protein [Desulfobacteraceae bacterium]
MIKLKNYSAVEFYEHLIDLYALMASTTMMGKRIIARSAPEIKLIYSLYKSRRNKFDESYIGMSVTSGEERRI